MSRGHPRGGEEVEGELMIWHGVMGVVFWCVVIIAWVLSVCGMGSKLLQQGLEDIRDEPKYGNVK